MVLGDREPTRTTPKTSIQNKSDKIRWFCVSPSGLINPYFFEEGAIPVAIMLAHYVEKLNNFMHETSKVLGKHERNVDPTGWCHTPHGKSLDYWCSTKVSWPCHYPIWRWLLARTLSRVINLRFFLWRYFKCKRTKHTQSKNWNYSFVKKMKFCKMLQRARKSFGESRELVSKRRYAIKTKLFFQPN